MCVIIIKVFPIKVVTAAEPEVTGQYNYIFGLLVKYFITIKHHRHHKHHIIDCNQLSLYNARLFPPKIYSFGHPLALHSLHRVKMIESTFSGWEFN